MFIRCNQSKRSSHLPVVLALLGLLVLPAQAMAEAVCAVVKIEIKQELTLERQAFEAVMRINNGLENASLTNVNIDVLFTDETGQAVLASSDPNAVDAPGADVKFFLAAPDFLNIDAIDGTGWVAPASTAEIRWTIIPTVDAGGTLPSGVLYFVGATLSYDLAGETKVTNVTPDSIYVKPLPVLALDYFLPRDVYADDPFTTEVEASEPFSLGVRVKNTGAAAANNVKIDSAQPAIVDNDLGLAIKFQILNSQVDERAVANSLLLDFGSIESNRASNGRWNMITTLSGKFTDFTANIAHADELGGALTSLIPESAIHTRQLVRDVLVDLPGRDLVRDYLALDIFNPAVSDVPVLTVYESTGLDTAVVNQSASVTLTPNGTDGTYDYQTLSTPLTSGFMYVQLVDPYGGTRPIAFALRNDGKNIPKDNVWLSKTFDSGTLTWSYFINLFDATSSSNTYSIAFAALPQPPVLTVATNVVTFETNPTTIPASATDPDGTTPALSVESLPGGASFTDHANGTGDLNWTPAVGQAGIYNVMFVASDGLRNTRTAVAITVNPAWDTDGDGMDDDWEREHFGDLSRDGTGDFDGDGISDLEEYLSGFNPTLIPPTSPSGFSGAPGNAEITLSWFTDPTASYNLYWSNTPGVTKNSNLIAGVASPYVHTALLNDQTYYYAISAVGAGGESALSVELSVTTGLRKWDGPALLESDNSNDALNNHTAFNAQGSGVVVWQHWDGALYNISARHYSTSGGWSAAAALIETDNSGDAVNPKVAMDANGNAMAVWRHHDGLRYNLVAARYLSGIWQAVTPLEINDYDAFEPHIVSDTNGNFIALWSHSDATSTDPNEVWSSRFDSSTGLWSTAVKVENNATMYALSTGIAANTDGSATAVWVQSNDASNYEIWVNQFDPIAGWSTAQQIRASVTGDATQPIVQARVATDGNGNATVVWFENDTLRTNIWARHYNGTWGTAALIETNDTGPAYAPHISMNANGDAIAVWQHVNGTNTLWSNQYQTGVWGTAQQVDSGSTTSSQPQVALDNNGGALAVWQQTDVAGENLWSARLSGGSWNAVEIIDTENTGDALGAQLAMNSNGDAVLSWHQYNGTVSNVWGNHYKIGNAGIPNIAPVAHAGTDQSVSETDLSVSLDATTSMDQDGSITAYSWTQTAGPAVTLTGAATATASFAPVAVYQDTVLTFQISITDDDAAISTATMNVTLLNTNPDDDGDGIDDAWEMQYFGNLNQNGSADGDLDGFTDLQEYQQQTNPTLATPNAPTDLQSTPNENQVGLQWSPVAGATSYNLYWSTSPDVNKTNATKVSNVSSPHVQTGLINGATYYYRITAAGSDESVVSSEVSSTPSWLAWKQPTTLNSGNDLNSSFNARLDFNDNGFGIAAWVQDDTSGSPTVYVSQYTPGSGWGTALDLTPVDTASGYVDVGIDNQNNAIVVWTQIGSGMVNIYSKRYTSATQWGVAEELNNEVAGDYVQHIELEMVANGSAFVTWNVSNSGNQSQWARRYDSVSGWGAVQSVDDGIGNSYFASLAVGNNGDAVLVWRNVQSGLYSVWNKRYQEGSGWSVSQALVTGNATTVYTWPNVAMDNNGVAVAVWNEVDITIPTQHTYRVWSSHYSPGTGWNAEQLLDNNATGTAAFRPMVAINNNGTVAATWLQADVDSSGSIVESAEDIKVAIYETATGWGSVSTIGNNYLPIYGWARNIVLDSFGNITLTWQEALRNLWGLHYVAGKGWNQKTLLNKNPTKAYNSPRPHDLVLQPNGKAVAMYLDKWGSPQVSNSDLFDAPSTADAGTDQQAYANDTLSLNGSLSSGPISAYHWRHYYSLVDDAGLSSADQITGNFTVPQITAGTEFLFALITTSVQGALATDVTKVTVLESDSDNDGLHDQWELNNFGNLGYEAAMDPDLDGVSNYDEYSSGTDPNTPNAPTAPAVVHTAGADTAVKVAWSGSGGASSYNLYWATTPGVTKATGNKITGVSSTFNHTGLTGGSTYYYVVTAVNGYGESSDSVESSATTGTKAWATSTLELNVDTATEPRVAVSDNGSAMTVWQQLNGGSDYFWANPYDKTIGWNGASTLTSAVGPRQMQMDPWGNTLVAINMLAGYIYSWNFNGTAWTPKQIYNPVAGHNFFRDISLDMNNQGEAILAAITTDNVLVSFRFVNSAWMVSPITGYLDTATVATAAPPVSQSVTIDNNGNSIVIWTQSDGLRTNVWASRYSNLKYAWDTPVLIETTDLGDATNPSIKMDANGNAIAIWQQSDGSVNSLWSNRYVNGSGWGTAQLVESSAEESQNPKLGIDLNGDAVVVWEQGAPVNAIGTNRFSATGGWAASGTIPLAGGTSAPNSPTLGVSPSGDAWLSYIASKSGKTYVRANTFTPASGWGAMQTLNSNGNSNSNPDIAVNAKGEAFLVYEEWDGVRNNIISQVRK
ncbi:MAG: hypothetical protein OEZ68_18160 [Gammaproteobacteria bacterium]|nr:hypothetical protein [Gammaproteobacteria bacterium]MDH5802730.1 hypothetical protein [Gammaproteobacteria bacterium]